jgi:hypothetical protein
MITFCDEFNDYTVAPTRACVDWESTIKHPQLTLLRCCAFRIGGRDTEGWDGVWARARAQARRAGGALIPVAGKK